MSYKKIMVNNQLNIESLVTIHYFEYMNNFSFAGEKHNFWEFLCVDKGEIEVFDGRCWQVLQKGDIIFHKPMEFHSLRANGIVAPNLVVISFDCNSDAMRFFENKVLSCNKLQMGLLSSIIYEARKVFSCPLDDPYITEMTLREDADFASLQLIRLYLEQLLIDMYRANKEKGNTSCPKITTFAKEKADIETTQKIVAYLEKNVRDHITIEAICKDNLISYSRVKQLFHDQYKCGVMEYFNKLKIDMAKQLVRDGGLNISEIADHMGYSSIHYFSRQFKQLTGMSPTEYASSIMVRSEVGFKCVFMTA